MTKYIIIFLILLSANVPVMGAVDSVKINRVSTVPSKVDNNWIVSTPRNHIVCLSASGELVLTTKNDPNEYFLKYTADTGTSWTDSLNEASRVTTGLSNHHHLTVENDTLYITDIPDAGSGVIDTGYIWIVDATGSLTEIRESFFEVETDNADRVYIGEARKLPNSDTIIYIYRDQDLFASNVSFVISDDEFATVSSSSFVLNGGVDCRVGMFDFNGSVSAQIYWRDSALSLYHYNRTTHTFVAETNQPFSQTSSRNYSVTSLGDTLLFASLEGSSPDTLYYAWRHKDTATWHTGTLAIHDANIIGKVCMMAQEATQTVFAFYSMDTVSGLYNVWYKYWENGTWSSEVQIVGDSINAYKISAPDVVPVSHGNVAYLYINDLTNSLMKLMVLDIYTTEESDCSNADADSVITLPYTIGTGANGTSGNPTIFEIDCSQNYYSTTTGASITISSGVEYVTIRGQSSSIRDTIVGNTGDNANYEVIDIAGSTVGITLENLVIIDGATADSTVHVGTELVSIEGGTKDFLARNCTFKTYSRGSQALLGKSGSMWNVWLDSCTFIDSSLSFLRRDFWEDNANVYLGQLNNRVSGYADFEYHLKVTNTEVVNTNWSHFVCKGDSLIMLIDSVTAHGDAINNLDTNAASVEVGSAEECFMFAALNATDGLAKVNITNTDVTTGDVRHGMGLFFTTCYGSDSTSDGIYFYNVTYDGAKRPAGDVFNEESYATSTIWRQRQGGGGVLIDNCNFASVQDDNNTLSTQAVCIVRIEQPNPTFGTHPILIKNNTFHVACDNTFTANYAGGGTNATIFEFNGINDYYGMDNIVIRGNVLESGNIFYHVGNENSTYDTTAGLLISYDTLSYITDSTYNPFFIGHGAESRANYWTDLNYGSVDYTDINFVTNSESFIQKTLQIIINDTLGSPLENVICTVKSDFGNTVVIDTTNASGVISNPVTIYYENGTPADSTNAELNNYVISYGNGVIDSSGTYMVDWNRGDTTFVLGAQAPAAEAVIKGKYRKVHIRKGKI